LMSRSYSRSAPQAGTLPTRLGRHKVRTKIIDAARKPEWVRDLGAVLHDAGLEDEPK
jgi:hypothetical protein